MAPRGIARSLSLGVALVTALATLGAAQASPELVKLRIENVLKRAQFQRDLSRATRLRDRSMAAAEQADVHITKLPKFGMKDAQADRMIGTAQRELDLLSEKPPTARRTARIRTLKAQLAEYEAMPRTGPRTAAFVLVGTDQIYLRLDRKNATPAMLANTMSHEMVHIRDLPKTTALWKATSKDPSARHAYQAFLTDGETRAYGEGSRVGARLGESPFGIGQPITDSNAPDHKLVQRSITDGYIRGVEEAMVARGLVGNTAARRDLTASYLAGYRAGLPAVLEAREAWKLANPPKEGIVAAVQTRINAWTGSVRRFFAVAMQPLHPIDGADAAFAAGQADVTHDLNPLSRIARIVQL